MARLFGFSGRITGRKGDAVFSVRKGEQIVRQYNPMVLNPNTEAQTVQRSKMKLSSQLAAIFSEVIAIPSEGAKTSRNIFTKINFPLFVRDTEAEGIKVSCDLPKLQLTNSGRAMIPFGVARGVVQGKLFLSLLQDATETFDRVVYVQMTVLQDGTVMYLTSKTAAAAGEGGRFSVQFDDANESYLFYAYGIKDLSSAAKTSFQNTNYEDGTQVASLISSRMVSASDAQVSMTAGLLVAANETIKSSNGVAIKGLVNMSSDVVTSNFSGLVAATDSQFVIFESKSEDEILGVCLSNGMAEDGDVIDMADIEANTVVTAFVGVGDATQNFFHVFCDEHISATYNPLVTMGEATEVTATPNAGYAFDKFMIGEEEIEENPYEFYTQGGAVASILCYSKPEN